MHMLQFEIKFVKPHHQLMPNFLCTHESTNINSYASIHFTSVKAVDNKYDLNCKKTVVLHDMSNVQKNCLQILQATIGQPSFFVEITNTNTLVDLLIYNVVVELDF